MSRATGARLLAHQVRYEQLAYWRNPPAAFFSAVFPLMFLVIFASLNADARLEQLGGISYNQYYVPAITAFGVIGACYTNLAMTLAMRRHYGQLKRKRTTPLPAWALIGGLIGSSIVVSTVLVVLTLGAGVLLYDVQLAASSLPAMAFVIALGAACFCSLGIALQTVIPNADAAPAIINAVLLPLVFISGTFFPVADDGWPGRVAGLFPIRHFGTALFDAATPSVAGGVNPADLLWLAGWLVVGVLVAVRRFRWEPGRR